MFVGSLMAQGIIDEGAEPNDFTGTPTLITCGSRIDGNLTAGDFDYYQILVAAPTLVKAYTSIGRDTTARVDTYLEVRDSLDQILAEDDDSGQGASSYVGCHLTQPGVYYLVVRGFATTTAGNYTVDVLCTSDVVVEGAEPNNTTTTATVATSGFEHHGEITAGDDDWYQVIHTGGNLVVSSGPGGHDVTPSVIALEDTVIDVYDSNLVLQGSADDEGESLYSALSLNLAPGIYYVSITAFGAADFGFYSLHIGSGEPAIAEATVSVGVGTPAGCPGASGTPNLMARSSNTLSTGTRVRPRIGTTFCVDASNLPPSSLVIHIIGLSTPAPFDLGPIGAPGCFVAVSPELTSLGFADAAGKSRSAIALPNNVGFIGLGLHWQTASFFTGHNPLGVAMSNVLSGVVNAIAFQ